MFKRVFTSMSKRVFTSMTRRTIVDDVVQGIIAGGGLAFITFQILAHAHVSLARTQGG